MANLYQLNQDMLIHLTANDMYTIIVAQVEGGGRNYYGKYDIIYGNTIPIPKKMAMEVIDMVKEGKICDVEHSFLRITALTFRANVGQNNFSCLMFSELAI